MIRRLGAIVPIRSHDPLPSFQIWARSVDLEPNNWRRSWVPRTKDPATSWQVYPVMVPPILPQRQVWPLATHTMRKGNAQTFWGLLNIRSDLILITGDSKHQHGPPVRVRTYQFQVISGGSLAQVWLTVGPANPWTHPMVIPTVPKCTVQYKYTHTDALICGEIQVENSETGFFPNPVQNSKSKAIKLPGGMAENNPKGCILPPFTSPAWPLQKPDRAWRMTVDNTTQPSPNAAAAPDVVYLLDQMNMALVTWNVATELANTKKRTRNR